MSGSTRLRNRWSMSRSCRNPLDLRAYDRAHSVSLLSEAATAPSETFLILERIAPAPSESGSSWRGEFFSGGAMSERRTVPVAYVTKWATTQGICIVRNGALTDAGALSKGFLYASAGNWTEDKAEAEQRYRAKIDAARQSAERKVKKLEVLYKAAPKYTDG